MKMLLCRAPVNRLVNLTESTIASGDDNGCIKVSILIAFVLVIFFSCHYVILIDLVNITTSDSRMCWVDRM